MQFVILYVTAPDVETARRLGRGLVEKRLAACANLLPQMQSQYWWDGKIEEANECVLIVKTRKSNFANVVAWINREHPYECPCIVELDIKRGNPNYLKWLESNTSSPPTLKRRRTGGRTKK